MTGPEKFKEESMSETRQECRFCAGGCGEQAKYAELDTVIESYKDREGCLIMVLHAAQEIFGYLPIELQTYIADKLIIPLSEVYGVVSFYSFFSMKECGKHTLRVCLGTACYVRGGMRLIEHIKEKLNVEVGGTTADKTFTFEVARCIGACGLAPAIMIDDEVYKHVTPKYLDEILAGY